MPQEALATTMIDGVVSSRLNGHTHRAEAISSAMSSLARVVGGISTTDIPVLLVGESGSGKQVLAAEIHRLSRQCQDLFVHVSCTSLNSSSFSDWLQRIGQRFEPGAWKLQGTLYLDEIGQLDSACQDRLLAALPTGSGLPGFTQVPYRLISSTRRDLQEEMRAQRFREELYYRINGACLRVPPLRHRKEDIPLLIEHFLIKYAAKFNRPIPAISEETRSILQQHSWPGNVRELENVAKNIVALGEDQSVIRELMLGGPRSVLAGAADTEESISLKRVSRKASMKAERELILKALGRTRWNRRQAAQELRISYKALLYKMKQIGVDDSASS
jgi:two-component system, NtrC family, response regulator AtoC